MGKTDLNFVETKPDRKKYDKRSLVARRHPGDKKRDSFGKFLASYSFITALWRKKHGVLTSRKLRHSGGGLRVGNC